MSLLHSEYRDRLAHWQRVLASDFYRPLESIQFDGFTTMRHLTPGQAAQGPFCPMEEGTAWGHTWEYMWCRADITLPEAAADKTVAMELDLGGEATLFVNGKAFGTRRAEWVSVPHHYICDIVPNRGSVFHFCLRCTRGIIFRMWEAAAQDRCFPELCRTLRRKAAAAGWDAIPLASGTKMLTSSGWMFPLCPC